MPNFIVQQNEKFKEVNTAEFYIEIAEGDFTGLSFVFGPIEFLGEDEEGNGRVKFDYHLLETPEFVILEEHREQIEGVVGMVLHKILEDMSKTPAGENLDETGSIDTEQPVEG
jgi:hypothetical protein